MSDFAESIVIWLPGSLAMLLLILLSGFFSASETSLFFLSRDEIRGFGSGSGRQRMVASLMANPDRVLTAILFWNLLLNLACFSVGLVVVSRLSHGGFTRVAAAVGIINLVGVIVLGEVFPKSMAVAFRHRLAPLISWPLAFAVALLDPVVPALGSVAHSLRRAFWPHVTAESHLSSEDLEHAVDGSAALGADMLDLEQQVLHNILDLSEIRVVEVMRPRNHCQFVRPTDTFETLAHPVQDADYLLVQEPQEDHVSRAVVLGGITVEPGREFGTLAEPVIYVPWCASLAYTLSELQRNYRSVAVVVYELGDMAGVVTYEDILETMLTESPSRTRRILRREPVISIGSNRFHADGLTTMRFLAGRLRVDFDPAEDGQSTINGFFHDELERFGEVGDMLVWRNWKMTVIEAAARGKLRVLIEPLPSLITDPGDDNREKDV